MAANLDDIVIEIEARLDRLETSMKGAEKIVENSTERMDRTVSRPGISFRRALTRTVAIVAGMTIAFRLAQVAMQNLDDTAKLFSGNMDTALQGAGALIRKLEQVPILNKTIFAAVRGLEDVLLLVRRQFEGVFAGLQGAQPGSMEAFINDLFGGGAMARQRDSLGDAMVALRNQVLARLQIAQATTKQEERDLQRLQEINRFRRTIETLRGRAQGLGLTGIDSMLDTIFENFRKALGLERRKDVQTAPARLEAFRTPLGIARFGQGRGGFKQMEILLEEGNRNTAQTAKNTRDSGPK